MDTINSLFPETSPIWFTEKHFLFLEKCILYYPHSVLQKKLISTSGIDKTTISEIKSDFMRLGWCKDVQLGSGKEIEIKLCRIDEVKLFLTGWKSIGHAIPVRPHDAKACGLFLDKPENFEKAVESLTSKYQVQISAMQNNKKYTIKMEYGKIILHLNGKLIEFWVDGFILPILQKDVALLQDYICNGIEERLFCLHSLLKEHFKYFRIKITDCFVLKYLSVGILTKKNVSNVLSISHKLKEIGLFKDNSVYNCDEWEHKGKLDQVLNRITSAINLIFEKQEELQLYEKSELSQNERGSIKNGDN